MSVKKEDFGVTSAGDAINLYTIENASLSLSVTNVGACIVRLKAPDKYGKADDVVLGFERGEAYLDNPDYFGGIVGPSANRVRNGEVVIDGVSYAMPQNEGANNLHTDAKTGLHKRLWDAEEAENGVAFSTKIRDGMYGLPGNREIRVVYTVTAENAVRIAYEATSDAPTLFNPTNHAYFNLAGHGISRAQNDDGALEAANGDTDRRGAHDASDATPPDIGDHVLQLYARAYTPVDDALIPDGTIADVKNTPFDFLTEKPIGRDIDLDDPQLARAGGYDHNFVIDGWQDDLTLRPAAKVFHPASGRTMRVFTTLPGVQFYAGNAIHDQAGKYGATYRKRCAFCLETQYFPDSAHHAAFAKPFFSPDKPYRSVTEYRFS